MLTANERADTRGNHKDLGGSCHGTHIGRLGVNDLHVGARQGEELRHRAAHDGAPPHHNRASPADLNLVRSKELHHRCGSCWEQRSIKVACAQTRSARSRDPINVFLHGNPGDDAGSVHSFREWRLEDDSSDVSVCREAFQCGRDFTFARRCGERDFLHGKPCRSRLL
jgi:hypothetical protein